MKLYQVLMLSITLACLGCTKESDDATLPLQPKLELVNQSAIQLTAFVDTLYLTLAYEDGDGDLGGFSDGSALYVLDSRLTAPDKFSLERLTPNGEQLSITGSLRVVLGPYFILGNADEETLGLELWITDRSGKESNHVIADDIRVVEP